MGDVRNARVLSRAIASSRAAVVFHLAAQSLVKRSYADPLETYSTNVMGTANLLEAARSARDLKAIVVVTSDKCYRNEGGRRPFVESMPLGGHDPYSSSKACQEVVAAAYARSFFSAGKTALATVRAGNVIGGGDWAKDRLVPDILKALASRRPVMIRNPRATRPWQHVLDPLAGYLGLAEKLHTRGRAFEGGWNFGPDASGTRSVRWVTETLIGNWGSGSWKQDPAHHPFECHDLRLDATKARRRLGWKPKLGLERALDWTAEWADACRDARLARSVTDAQIAAYEEL